ncbi:metallophosphoesterase family protein [Bradyrhizobium liaoningense]
MGDSITFAIGDIHGCSGKLQALITLCDTIRDGRNARFILLGDYIDRGPESQDVLDLLMRQDTDPSRHFIFLRGNHEEMLIRVADKDRSDRDLMTWWGNGGEQTLESYGVNDPSDVPPEHLDWMRSLPLQTSDQHRLFVHAGIRPGVAMLDQPEQDLLWIREPFLSSNENHGTLVVHGHTPTRSRRPDLRANRLNIDTGACFGGPLTAAVFSDEERGPLFFVEDSGKITTPPRGPKLA